MLKLMVAAGGAFALAGAAAAADRVAYQAIAAGDFTVAVQRLEAERRIHPGRPELMLNLAAAYHRLGRIDEAQTLYRQVLERPAVSLNLPSGAVASSRDLAQRGLARGSPTLAAR